jgi:hypothetical protein
MAKNSPRPGPYSRLLRRGAIGKLADGRTELGRFIRDLEAQLVAHVGGRPTITQRLLIERLIKTHVQLDMLDDKLQRGDWTANDSRTYGGLLNALRLTSRELGLDAASDKPQRLADVLAEATAARVRGGVAA